MCWWGNLSVSDKSKLKKQLVNICGKVIGQQQLSLSNIYDRQVFKKKAKQISTAHTFGLLLPSKKRFRISACKTNRCLSFIPGSICLLNDLAKASNFLVRVCVCVCVCVCACVCVCVCGFWSINRTPCDYTMYKSVKARWPLHSNGVSFVISPLDLLYSDTENTKHSVVALLDRLQTYWYQVKRIMCQNPIFNRWKKTTTTKQKQNNPPKKTHQKTKKPKNKYKHTEKQTNKQQQQKRITKSDFQFVHLRE